MKSTVDCMPCFLRQALETARMISDDTALHETVLRQVLAMTAGMDLNIVPPAMGRRVHQLIRELTETPDPYKAVKQRYNRLALDWLPELKSRVSDADDPFGAAVRLAVAGNIIDFGVDGTLCDQKVQDTIDKALHQAVDEEVLGRLQQEVRQAETILYLGDNAGEIVFDRLLLEFMADKDVTYVVKGSPIINDATMDDAEEAGLTGQVRVIDNGSNAPGTILEECSPAFQAAFEQADLILAKGQGNYETLNESQSNLFFLFQAKCQVVARHVGKPIGSFILCRSDSFDRVMKT